MLNDESKKIIFGIILILLIPMTALFYWDLNLSRTLKKEHAELEKISPPHEFEESVPPPQKKSQRQSELRTISNSITSETVKESKITPERLDERESPLIALPQSSPSELDSYSLEQLQQMLLEANTKLASVEDDLASIRSNSVTHNPNNLSSVQMGNLIAQESQHLSSLESKREQINQDLNSAPEDLTHASPEKLALVNEEYAKNDQALRDLKNQILLDESKSQTQSWAQPVDYTRQQEIKDTIEAERQKYDELLKRQKNLSKDFVAQYQQNLGKSLTDLDNQIKSAKAKISELTIQKEQVTNDERALSPLSIQDQELSNRIKILKNRIQELNNLNP